MVDQFLASNQTACAFDEHLQDANGLVLYVKADAVLLNFTGDEIGPERAKGIDGIWIGLEHLDTPALNLGTEPGMLSRVIVPNNE